MELKWSEFLVFVQIFKMLLELYADKFKTRDIESWNKDE